jgi:phospholipid/cholesterol/gamma-HCH transport system permease protein
MWQRPVQMVGGLVLDFFEESGRLFLLFGRIIAQSRTVFRDRRLLLEQMVLIGTNSLPLVAIIATFTGAVSAWQAAYQFEGKISLSLLGSAVSTAIFIELGPVLTAVILAGRIGASIAAELGTMKVTEQIDALETLAINPVRYLAMPRFFAATVMTPILTIFADFIALLGAYLVSYVLLDLTTYTFFDSAQQAFTLRSVFGGLAKAFVFGAIISTVGCYIGFQTSGGAEGVGRATIRAFVLSSTLILMNDYILATIIF